MSKKFIIPIIFVGLLTLLIPLTTLAQSDGIPLQKDVFLEYPITTTEDLPDQITFNLYDSQTATIPIGAQTFARGEYTVDFEFSKSDGRTSGTVARINAKFTNKLDINSDPESATKTKEIWVDIEVGGAEIGDRTKVSDGTLVQLLLASDASIATYLTLVYEGDDNPITTIYRDLPLSSSSSDSSGSSLSSYFSSLFGGSADSIIGPRSVAGSDGQIQYNNGGVEGGAGQFYYDDTNHRVGIGTSSPNKALQIVTNQSGGGLRIQGSRSPRYQMIDTTTPMIYEAAATDTYAMIGTFSNHDVILKTNDISRLYIKANGRIGIGTDSPAYELAVNGTIRAKEIIVDTGWSDFVFEDGYRLPPLTEVEQFISKNNHLSGIPTAVEVQEKGVTLGSISSKLLQKIEELTLYVIDLKKENDSVKAQLVAIHEQLNNITQQKIGNN